jgi:hypothetical protein
MDHSIFMDKAQAPTDHDLKQVLGDKYPLWMDIPDRVYDRYTVKQ